MASGSPFWEYFHLFLNTSLFSGIINYSKLIFSFTCLATIISNFSKASCSIYWKMIFWSQDLNGRCVHHFGNVSTHKTSHLIYVCWNHEFIPISSILTQQHRGYFSYTFHICNFLSNSVKTLFPLALNTCLLNFSFISQSVIYATPLSSVWMPSSPYTGSNIPFYIAFINEFPPHTTWTVTGPLLSGNASLAGFRLFSYTKPPLCGYTFLTFFRFLIFMLSQWLSFSYTQFPSCFVSLIDFALNCLGKKRGREGKEELGIIYNIFLPFILHTQYINKSCWHYIQSISRIWSLITLAVMVQDNSIFLLDDHNSILIIFPLLL